jgi:hypothetical protein
MRYSVFAGQRINSFFAEGPIGNLPLILVYWSQTNVKGSILQARTVTANFSRLISHTDRCNFSLSSQTRLDLT